MFFIHTFKLPLAQYSVTIQIFGGSVQAPINEFKLSCRRSRILRKKSKPQHVNENYINFQVTYVILRVDQINSSKIK